MNLMFPPNMGYPNLMGNGMMGNGMGMGMDMGFQQPSMVGNTAAPPSAYAIHRKEPVSPTVIAGIGALATIAATAIIFRRRSTANVATTTATNTAATTQATIKI